MLIRGYFLNFRSSVTPFQDMAFNTPWKLQMNLK
jgi:hypothetical protein